MTAHPDTPIVAVTHGNPVVEFHLGDLVQTTAGPGRIEFIAYSNSMGAAIFTVSLDPRIKLRLLGRDLTLVRRA